MKIDLSHAGEQTFYDVLRITSKPVLVSHSNAAALTPHYRNLKDDQLKALKENGGVVGVNFYSEFLDVNYSARVKELYRKNHPVDSINRNYNTGKMYNLLSKKEKHLANASLEDVLKHIDHLVKFAGIDHVAIGSDFDGIESPPAKIMGLNFLRVLKENEN
jgi:membrane dipeptidase